jgi:hypothetical protein
MARRRPSKPVNKQASINGLRAAMTRHNRRYSVNVDRMIHAVPRATITLPKAATRWWAE